MAPPPSKSQPLHNFSLPNLKWAHKNSSPATAVSTSHNHHQRSRRREFPDQLHRRHPTPDSEPEARATISHMQPNAEEEEEEEEENGEGKTWNMRPRKEVVGATPTLKKATAGESNDGKNYSNGNGVKSKRLRGLVEGEQLNGGVERQKKRKLWISLSREEIEEDVYALTGGRPARRPRKWPKIVQKQLDNVFPGLYLVGIAADSYRVQCS